MNCLSCIRHAYRSSSSSLLNIIKTSLWVSKLWKVTTNFIYVYLVLLVHGINPIQFTFLYSFNSSRVVKCTLQPITQKQTNIWHTSTNSSSINIKIITTLQIYIINKHVKLDKSNKDKSCNRTLSFNHDCRKGTCLWHKCVSVHKFFVMSRWQFYFFRNFLLNFCFQNNS